MKLLTFALADTPDKPRFGLLDPSDESQVIDPQAVRLEQGSTPSGHFRSLLEFLQGGDDAQMQLREVLNYCQSHQPTKACYALGDIQLLAPLPQPISIRDCMVFEQHVIQSTRTVAKWKYPVLWGLDWVLRKCGHRGLAKPPKAWYKYPLCYFSNTMNVVGPEAEIRWPIYTDKLDFELEVAIVIGKAGRNIPRERVWDHIAGFVIYNDFSARDIQLEQMGGRLGPGKGKSFDTGNALGPWLVTLDEIRTPQSLDMEVRVNGECWATNNTRHMYHSWEDIIVHLSHEETLYPGEVIGSGTAGGGCGLEQDRWIQPGDVIELEIEGLGVLRNRIGEKPTPL